MQRKTKKIYDTLMIIFNILLLVFMMLSIILKNDRVYALYWIMVSLMCNFLAVMTANKDSKELIEKTFNYKK